MSFLSPLLHQFPTVPLSACVPVPHWFLQVPLPLPAWLPCLTRTLCLAAVTGNSTTVCGGGAAGFGGGMSLGGGGGASKGGFSTSVGYGAIKGGPVSGGTSILRKTTTVKTSSRRY